MRSWALGRRWAREPERVDEAQDVAGHVLDVVGHETGRGADAAVVEQDDLAVRGETVDQRGVPVVQVAAEVLQAHQRWRVAPAVAEAAIDERRAADLDRAVHGA